MASAAPPPDEPPASGVALLRDASGLLELRLARPPLNEIGEAILAGLEQAADALERGDARGLLITSGLERGFSAGADLRALARAIAERGHAACVGEVRAFLGRINRALTRIDEAGAPSAAALHGACFGGGLELALACDLRVADRTARLALPELRLGLVPGFGGLARLRRDVGLAAASDLLLTGRSLGAERAHALGLVGQVVAPGRAAEAARRALEQALRHDGAATAAAKRLLRPPLGPALDDALETFLVLFARPEVARALAAFVERDDALPYVV